MISIMMYSRRFFPYYTNTTITGLDTDGKGCIYSFDPVGSMGKELYSCQGSAMALILPILDSCVSCCLECILQLLDYRFRFLEKILRIRVQLNEQKKKLLK